MMRDEMLKRLDELMQWVLTVPYTIPAEVSLETRREAWQDLRAELAAERCEHCRYFVERSDLLGLEGECRGCAGLSATTRKFCCSHFTKRES